MGEKIRVKRDTHTLLSKGLARASKKQQRGVGSFESIEKRQTRNAFFERFERNLDRVIEEDTITRTKKIDIIIRFQMPHNKSEALSH